MHHAAAEDLEPVFALAEADLVAFAGALDVHLHRRFGEGKERGPEAHAHLLDLEEGAAEFLQHPFEVGQIGALVDHQALDLMEHRRMGLVGILAIGPARDRRRGSAASGPAWCGSAPGWCGSAAVGVRRRASGLKKNVSCISRAGWPAREVQRREIEEVGLDVRPFGDREPHVGEDGGDLVRDLADRMDAAGHDRLLAHRQGDVERLGGKPCRKRLGVEHLATRSRGRRSRGPSAD